MKNPAKVRAGRLGAASLHSRGLTNTGPARAAFMARFEKEVDPEGVLSPADRHSRAEHARKAYFIRIRQMRRS